MNTTHAKITDTSWNPSDIPKTQNPEENHLWIGNIMLSKDPAGHKHIFLGLNKSGVICILGGSPDNPKERPEVTAIRETKEESEIEIQGYNLKEIWRGKSEELDMGEGKDYIIYKTNGYTPFFKARKITTDEDIIEVRSYSLPYVLNYMIRHDKNFNTAHARILKKLRRTLLTA